ncbi:MFS general substrate transporter [Obba rivulosa]|uniref:MFS general substrate transporter n=1 Tax=Obba rivulosa TaxID=1052685 RepID=A0A8E2AU26_9APHY|nr:MFS general substrate transporter [Obba rivulosa]
MSMQHFTSTSDQNVRSMSRRLLWKLDIHILPSLALLWLASFIDRTNIGNANIAGLPQDLHLHGKQFNIALAVFYVPYILVELPSNWVLKRMKPSRWLPAWVAIWGIVTTLSGLVQNFSGLVAIRFFLGFCEGGLLPGIMLYLSTLYKPHELQQRVGVFYASASLSGAFGGLLASVITKMNGIGGLAGWRWIFILEGLATVLIAIISMMLLPADIISAKFLTEEEKVFAERRLRIVNAVMPTQDSVEYQPTEDSEPEKGEEVKVETRHPEGLQLNQEDEKFEWSEVVRGILEPQVWMTAISYLGIIVSLYSFSLFLPAIVTGLGHTGEDAQIHTVPPYVPAIVLTVVVAIASDKLRWRGPFILMFLPVTIAGYVLLIVAKTNTERYAAVFLVASGIYPCGPCILSIMPNNNSGHYKKATAVALQLGIANTGGFAATFIYDASQAPKYIKGHSITVAFVALAWVSMFCNVMYCKWENKARAEGRRQENLVKYQELWDSGKTRAPIGDRHPDFRFTL